MPKRIKLKRTAGWKMPANCRAVTRPGPFGNPFYVAHRPVEGRDELFRCTTNREAVDKFANAVTHDARLVHLIRTELRGLDLACFCAADQPCHADVLLRVANS